MYTYLYIYIYIYIIYTHKRIFLYMVRFRSTSEQGRALSGKGSRDGERVPEFLEDSASVAWRGSERQSEFRV